MNLLRKLGPLCVVLLAANASAGPLVSSPGDSAIIPGWSMQSATHVSADMRALSRPGIDVSQWYRVGARGTVMAGLIENGVYNDTHLWYSDNMKALDDKPEFREPWLYREEFEVNPSNGQYFILHTHGITSKADIYVNGLQIASSEEQQGSYGGHRYNFTNYLQTGVNCLLVRAYPTNCLRDLATGFADWNPYPADNGTGVWRHVEISQTGAVSMSPFRVITDYTGSGTPHKVNVTLKTDLVNSGRKSVQVAVDGAIKAPTGSEAISVLRAVEMKPGEAKTVSIKVPIKNPQIWWPAQWGKQPLYTVQANAIIHDRGTTISDSSRPQHFGIRHVSSHVNSHNDTAFSVNGVPFQVLGAGYSPDMFMRFDERRVQSIFQYVLDMGLNTVRLEGKQEHPELYTLADRMGIMVLTGWECCDKWEGWEYNDDAAGVKWGEPDYPVARASMLHEAEMMQAHPSLLGFLVGSDYWPNDRATRTFVDALKEMDWNSPIIASASKRGYPEALGPSGMKMDGPYDWVPPVYWYSDKEGAAFGLGSELGAGVGTPEMGSLVKFMPKEDLDTLWTEPDVGLYHMSTNVSPFYDRSIYNQGLFSRYGKPSSIEDYVAKCQMADYEATRAQFEAYSTRQNASQPATGSIYWMLNSVWPNLHWQLFDYYLRPMGSYFGTKVGARMEHAAYDYETKRVWLINHSLDKKGERQIAIDLIDADGKKISSTKVKTHTVPNSSKEIQPVNGINQIKGLAFLRLVLRDVRGRRDLSRNVYWLSPKPDVLDWSRSNWYYTPVTDYADYTKLQSLAAANVKVSLKGIKPKKADGRAHAEVKIENKSQVPAVFVRLNLIRSSDNAEIAPVQWSDNYVTVWPKEKLRVQVAFEGNLKQIVVEVSGSNF
ncbi:uncharacterized protein N7459_003825 [Penicillium hispanicum]|uniref:uncharacterized protein n=1 Tax=Penicillium hispanicum TaxID=1080232 RepID=UPI00254118C7|nr:uncharacterized protein N7459_003825 [Penicillium hispanicum]KAJ5584025.1 hypothetical protein N7459_003825 [Penicillium hispanicum]